MKPFDHTLNTQANFLPLLNFHVVIPAGKQGFIAQFKACLQRIQTRKQLAKLNDDQLLDIGLTVEQVRREQARPFWT